VIDAALAAAAAGLSLAAAVDRGYVAAGFRRISNLHAGRRPSLDGARRRGTNPFGGP
jgi:hypothetical protein